MSMIATNNANNNNNVHSRMPIHYQTVGPPQHARLPNHIQQHQNNNIPQQHNNMQQQHNNMQQQQQQQDATASNVAKCAKFFRTLLALSEHNRAAPVVNGLVQVCMRVEARCISVALVS